MNRNCAGVAKMCGMGFPVRWIRNRSYKVSSGLAPRRETYSFQILKFNRSRQSFPCATHAPMTTNRVSLDASSSHSLPSPTSNSFWTWKTIARSYVIVRVALSSRSLVLSHESNHRKHAGISLINAAYIKHNTDKQKKGTWEVCGIIFKTCFSWQKRDTAKKVPRYTGLIVWQKACLGQTFPRVTYAMKAQQFSFRIPRWLRS